MTLHLVPLGKLHISCDSGPFHLGSAAERVHLCRPQGEATEDLPCLPVRAILTFSFRSRVASSRPAWTVGAGRPCRSRSRLVRVGGEPGANPGRTRGGRGSRLPPPQYTAPPATVHRPSVRPSRQYSPLPSPGRPPPGPRRG